MNTRVKGNQIPLLKLIILYITLHPLQRSKKNKLICNNVLLLTKNVNKREIQQSFMYRKFRSLIWKSKRKGWNSFKNFIPSLFQTPKQTSQTERIINQWTLRSKLSRRRLVLLHHLPVFCKSIKIKIKTQKTFRRYIIFTDTLQNINNVNLPSWLLQSCAACGFRGELMFGSTLL